MRSYSIKITGYGVLLLFLVSPIRLPAQWAHAADDSPGTASSRPGSSGRKSPAQRQIDSYNQTQKSIQDATDNAVQQVQQQFDEERRQREESDRKDDQQREEQRKREESNESQQTGQVVPDQPQPEALSTTSQPNFQPPQTTVQQGSEESSSGTVYYYNQTTTYETPSAAQPYSPPQNLGELQGGLSAGEGPEMTGADGPPPGYFSDLADRFFGILPDHGAELRKDLSETLHETESLLEDNIFDQMTQGEDPSLRKANIDGIKSTVKSTAVFAADTVARKIIDLLPPDLRTVATDGYNTLSPLSNVNMLPGNAVQNVGGYFEKEAPLQKIFDPSDKSQE